MGQEDPIGHPSRGGTQVSFHRLWEELLRRVWRLSLGWAMTQEGKQGKQQQRWHMLPIPTLVPLIG